MIASETNDPYSFLDAPAPESSPPFDVWAIAQTTGGQAEGYLKHGDLKEAEEWFNTTLQFAPYLPERKAEVIEWAIAQGLKLAKAYFAKGDLEGAGGWVHTRIPALARRLADRECFSISGDIVAARISPQKLEPPAP
jgi:hypothetical protein